MGQVLEVVIFVMYIYFLFCKFWLLNILLRLFFLTKHHVLLIIMCLHHELNLLYVCYFQFFPRVNYLIL